MRVPSFVTETGCKVSVYPGSFLPQGTSDRGFLVLTMADPGDLRAVEVALTKDERTRLAAALLAIDIEAEEEQG